MVYCDLIKKDNDSATYSYSRGYGEKGVITFPLRKPEPYIIEKASNPKCGKLWINKLYARHIDDFLNGVVKERIAYEC